MLKELKFVQGAVAKKDFLPALTHFVIEAGTVRGYNGTLALCSPIPFNIDCKPKAEPLVRAINNCQETVTMRLTDTGRLCVMSGSFKAFVDCIQGETPHVEPEGQEVQFDGEQMLKAMKTLEPFIGSDASRPWTNGVLLRGQSAFATNNVCLVEYWLGSAMPFTVNVPAAAVREMLRVNEPPTHGQLTQNSITFHYTDGRWIRSQLYSTEWPDLARVLDRQAAVQPVDTRLFDGLEVIRQFADKMGRVYFGNQMIRTHLEDTEGAAYQMTGFEYEGVYQIEMLRLLQGVATQVDFSSYPDPCIFYGDRLRGAVVGMKL